MDRCAICKREVDPELAPMLTMSGFGVPRYTCEECAADFDAATGSTDVDAVSAALDRIGKKLPLVDVDDKVTLAAVADIIKNAKERAEKIQNGTYDFSLDTPEEEKILDELLESEEDRELDRRDAEKAKKIDVFMNYVCIGAVIGALGFFVYALIKAIF